MKTLPKKLLKLLLFALGGILALLILVFGGLNLSKFFIYGDYYAVKEDLCKNPGLSDGFVCQGICALEDEGLILISGYMKDDSASRIYLTTLDNRSRYVTLKQNGADFDGHAGGIASHGDTVYLADGGAIRLISKAALLAAENGEAVEIEESIPVNNAASFCYADENYLYVGEFHDGGKYVTDHPYQTPDGLYHAIVSRYAHTDLVHPDKIYAIRDKVQGIAFFNGKVVLSTSYGLTDSVYYVYNEADAIDSGEVLDGAGVYYLNSCQSEISGPAMAEGLDAYEGRIITLTESASDKYIFGKFFFADQIVSLDLI